MNIKKLREIVFLTSACLSFVAGQSGPDMGVSDVVVHSVLPGESMSLICIDYYGRFRGSMGDVIQRLNPGIKNLNQLSPGVTLKLPRPHQAASAVSDPTKLFERDLRAVQGVVTYVEGEAFLLPGSKGANTRLISNTIVYPGDIIETKAVGRVEVLINREIVVRMDRNSRIRINSYRNKKQFHESSSVQLDRGVVWSKVKEFNDGNGRFHLRLPTAVAEIHGTVYNAGVNETGETNLRVYRGMVSVTGEEDNEIVPASGSNLGEKGTTPGGRNQTWTRILRSNQRLRIDENGRASEARSVRDMSRGEWKAWNENRDASISQLFLEKAR